MTIVVESPYTNQQITAWLRGLLALAWADGEFDAEEQKLIATLTQDELAPKTDLASLDFHISPSELAAALGDDTETAQNFLRTAVMVALADGVYSLSEDKLLREFYQALGQEPIVLEALQHTIYEPAATEPAMTVGREVRELSPKRQRVLLKPVREWLDGLEIHEPQVARFLCKLIPAQCPFERNIELLGHKIVHIPPLCKLNPLYDQLVGLRFRALSYLADECGEDVSSYCQ